MAFRRVGLAPPTPGVQWVWSQLLRLKLAKGGSIQQYRGTHAGLIWGVSEGV